MEFLVFVLFIAVAVTLSNYNRRSAAIKRRKEAYVFTPENYDNPKSASSAVWATDKMMKLAGLFKGKGWRIGYSQSGKALTYGGPGHLLLVAGARTGKLVTVLAGALLQACKASRIIIDPKGEICAITHAKAAQFSEVMALDPFGLLKKLGIKGVKVVGLNPLAALDPNSASFGGDLESLNEAIIWGNESGTDRHFDDSARQLVGTVTRVVMKYWRQGDKNLVAVHDIISGNFFEFARRYVNCGDTAIRQGLFRYTVKGAEDSRELNSIISTAITQTAFLAMEGISSSLKMPGLRFADLKRKRMTVYIVLPLDKLASCGKWFRLCVASALGELLKAGPGGLPVLCVIDEFFSIGPLKAIQTAMSQAAGAAQLQLWPVLQDLAQLQSMYPHGEGWRTFLSNTALKIFFGGHGDKETSDYISELCGEREMVTISRSLHDDKRGPHYGGGVYDVDVTNSGSTTWQRLIHPHEVRRLGGDEMIVFSENCGGPILAKRRPYWKTSRGYGRNPYYTGGGFFKKFVA
jgi:type IV secretion system protein VirD4